MKLRKSADPIDTELRRALDDTVEDWKRALVIGAIESRKTNRWLVWITAAALVVAIVSVLVALFR